ADVDVRSVRHDSDLGHLRTERAESLRGDLRIRAVRAVDAYLQVRQVGPEARRDVFEVAVGRNLDAVDLPAARTVDVEEQLDLFFGVVRELLPVAVKELDAVVLGRVVRRGDD